MSLDVSIATNAELEQEQERLHGEFEKLKSECYEKYLQMMKVSTDYKTIEGELSKRNFKK